MTWVISVIIKITNVEELASIAYSIDGNYLLMNDIDLERKSWDVLGDNSTMFSGVFDGNGYTIRNLTTTSITNYFGLFGANSGTIKNLNVENATITAGSIGASILVGYNSGVIDNCYVDGSVCLITDYIGGLIGYRTCGELTMINGNVSDCYSIIQSIIQIDCVWLQNMTLNSYLGGLIGKSAMFKYERCYSNGNMDTSVLKTSFATSYSENSYIYNATSYVGGIVGYDTAGEYLNTYSIITINNKVDCIAHYRSSYSSASKVVSSSYLGGIAGYTDESKINNSYASSNSSTRK